MNCVADVGVGDLLEEHDGDAVVLAAVLPGDDEGAPLGRLVIHSTLGSPQIRDEVKFTSSPPDGEVTSSLCSPQRWTASLQVGDLVLRAEPQPGRQDQPHQGVRVVVRPEVKLAYKGGVSSSSSSSGTGYPLRTTIWELLTPFTYNRKNMKIAYAPRNYWNCAS